MRLPPFIVSAIAATGIAGGTSFYVYNEDNKLVPYRDVAGYWTVCAGNTLIEMRTYTAEECLKINTELVMKEAEHVKKIFPEHANNHFFLAAVSSFSLNIGKTAAANSTAYRFFRVGDYFQGCLALGPYILDFTTGQVRNGFIFAKGKLIPGLVNRRLREAELCMYGISGWMKV